MLEDAKNEYVDGQQEDDEEVQDNNQDQIRLEVYEFDLEDECEEEESEVSPSHSRYYEQEIRKTDGAFRKPLLNSKKQLSSFLISGCQHTEDEESDHPIGRHSELCHQDSKDRRQALTDSPVKRPRFDSSLKKQKKNIRLYKEGIRENIKVRETDPVLLKIREGTAGNRMKNRKSKNFDTVDKNEYSNQDSSSRDNIQKNLSPIHKLLYKDSDANYNESYLYEVPLLNSKATSNFVLEGSNANKWRFFYHGSNIVQQFGYAREQNYSNSNYIHAKNRSRKHFANHSDLLMDNINEDVHSFIGKHRKEKNANIKSSYLYDEFTHNKNQRKSPSKMQCLNKSSLLRKKESSHQSAQSSFMNISGTRYDEEAMIRPQKGIITSLKLAKAKSTECADQGRNQNQRKLNRENPYKMSFSLHRK